MKECDNSKIHVSSNFLLSIMSSNNVRHRITRTITTLFCSLPQKMARQHAKLVSARSLPHSFKFPNCLNVMPFHNTSTEDQRFLGRWLCRRSGAVWGVPDWTLSWDHLQPDGMRSLWVPSCKHSIHTWLRVATAVPRSRSLSSKTGMAIFNPHEDHIIR
jgi:hypothetical protein